jgi:hypothetical protein
MTKYNLNAIIMQTTNATIMQTTNATIMNLYLFL